MQPDTVFNRCVCSFNRIDKRSERFQGWSFSLKHLDLSGYFLAQFFNASVNIGPTDFTACVLKPSIERFQWIALRFAFLNSPNRFNGFPGAREHAFSFYPGVLNVDPCGLNIAGKVGNDKLRRPGRIDPRKPLIGFRQRTQNRSVLRIGSFEVSDKEHHVFIVAVHLKDILLLIGHEPKLVVRDVEKVGVHSDIAVLIQAGGFLFLF